MRNQVKELESSDDAELLAAVREGNDTAFGELYRRHVGAGRAAARSLTRSTADADDAVAEAFARVLAVMRRGGGPEVAMRPYLMTVVRNVCFDRGTARDRETLPGETEVLAAVDDLPISYQNAELDQFTEANLVSRAFASLSDRWKHVLWQTDIEGRTPRELADELELAPTAVAALAFRAREGLADAYLAAHVTHRPTAQCDREPSELARYVRNRMRSKEQITFRAHLDQCHRCTEAVEELRVVSRPLRSLQWPALIGAPVITYGGRVIGIIRRVVTAQLLTTASAAAVTVATVGVATNNVPFEPFDALRPTSSYIEPQAAAAATAAPGHASSAAAATGSASEAAPEAAANRVITGPAKGTHRSVVFPALTSVVPTIALGGPTPVAPPTTTSPAGPTAATEPVVPTATTAAPAAADTTASGPTATLPPDEPSPVTTVPSAPTTEASAPAGGPVGGSETQSSDDGGAPTTESPTPTTVDDPGGISVTPIGGNPQTQSNDTDGDESSVPTTTTTTTAAPEPTADPPAG
jgi:RNA polymerase sigma factor (sigma-70 family)